MTNHNDDQSLAEKIATAAETVVIEGAPIIASVGQETGLGALPPDDEPIEEEKKTPAQNDDSEPEPHVTK